MIINYKRPIIVAEIGCNHKGSMDIAEQLIVLAAKCGATYAKFQKRDNKYLLGKEYLKPHPVPENSYGTTYGEHRENLEFSVSQHANLSRICKKNGINYAVSVWEKKSALKIIESKIKPDYLKVPSACNLDFELLETLAKKFKKKIHLSLGMTSRKETKKIVSFFSKHNRLKDIILYACTSDYPVDFENTCLLEISNLINNYRNKIHEIGFSGHHLGIGIDNAAYTLGARYVERHFTLDRTWKGTDHAASLEPSGLEKLSRDLNNCFKSLKFKSKNGILAAEKFQRNKLKKRLNIIKAT